VFYDAVRKLARNTMKQLYRHSALLNHAIEKPFGYAGDYQILENIYNGLSFVDSTEPCGKAIDQWALRTALPAAVRSRKNILQRILSGTNVTNVLSIAAGSARAIRDLEDSSTISSIDFLDFDRRGFHAFSFSDKVSFYRRNVLNGLKMKENRYDLIYSFGLFDYLEDTLVASIISESVSLLEPGGEFVFCLKDSRHYSRWFYDIFCDWRFVDRTSDCGHHIAERNGLSVFSEIMTINQVVAVYRCKRIDDD